MKRHEAAELAPKPRSHAGRPAPIVRNPFTDTRPRPKGGSVYGNPLRGFGAAPRRERIGMLLALACKIAVFVAVIATGHALFDWLSPLL